jgi:hemerythrin
LQEKTEEEEAMEEKFDYFDINHTAPQHRQYLGNFSNKYIQSIDSSKKCVSTAAN